MLMETVARDHLMFETRFRQRVTKYAAGLDSLQSNYIDCWTGLKKHFDPKRREPK